MKAGAAFDSSLQRPLSPLGSLQTDFIMSSSLEGIPEPLHWKGRPASTALDFDSDHSLWQVYGRSLHAGFPFKALYFSVAGIWESGDLGSDNRLGNCPLSLPHLHTLLPGCVQTQHRTAVCVGSGHHPSPRVCCNSLLIMHSAFSLVPPICQPSCGQNDFVK